MMDDLAGTEAQDAPSQPATSPPISARPNAAARPVAPRPQRPSLGRWLRSHPAVAVLAVIGVVELLVIALGAGVMVGQMAASRNEAARVLSAQREALRGETEQHTRAENDIHALEGSLYDSYVVAADLHYRLNDTERAQLNLDRCLPAQGETDRRGWEWRHLAGLVNADLLTMEAEPGRRAPVEGLAFRPDGKQVAVGRSPVPGGRRGRGMPASVFVCDAATGADDRSLEGLLDGVSGLLFSPDGATLAVGNRGSSTGPAPLGLWDAQTGKKVRDLAGSQHDPTPLSFSPDGSRLLVRGQEGLTLLDVKSGQAVSTYPGRVAGGFSTDGKTILIVGGDGRLSIRDAANGEQIRVLGRIATDLHAVAVSPTGTVIAASHAQAQGLTIFSADSGQILQRLIGHEGEVAALAFSPDGRWLASAGADRTVRVWDIAAGHETFVFRGHVGRVTNLAFSPGGERLASGDRQGDVKLWDLTRSPDRLTVTGPTRHGNPSWVVEDLAFSDHGKRVVALKLPGGRLQTWDAATGVLLSDRAVTTTTDVMFPGKNVSFDPTGERLAGASRGDPRLVKLWDVATGKELASFPGHSATIRQVDFSADGKRLVTAAWDFAKDPADVNGEVTVWDTGSHEPLFQLSGPGEQITAVALSAEGRLLAVAGFQNDRGARGEPVRSRLLFQVWDMESKREVATLGGHASSVLALTFTPDRRQLVSASADGIINVWDVRLEEAGSPRAQDGRAPLGTVPGMEPGKTSRHVQQFQGPSGLFALAFSPEGKRLAGMTRRQVTIWDATTAHEVLTLRSEAPSDGSPFNPRLRFGPAGARLVTNQADASLALWDAAVPSPASRAERVQAAAARAFLWHVREASQCRQAGQTFALEAHLAQLKGQRPPSGPVAALRGQLLLELGRWQEAEADLSFALEHDSDVAGVWAARGLCRAEQSRWEEAAADFDHGLTVLAGTGSPAAERADIENNLMKYDRVYTRLVELRPDNITLRLARSRFDALRAHWKESAAGFAQVPIASLLGEEGIEYASLLAMLGDWPAYQALCARLTEQAGQSPSPAQSYVLARAGGIGTESGVKADDLVRWGQSGTGAQVSKSEALFGLGLAFYRAGEFAECVARMEEAMRLSPGWSGHAMCWVALALSHDRLRHPDEARAWFTRADGLLTRATAAAQPAAEILPLPQGIPLADWLEFQALYREAKGALGGK